MEVIAVSHVHSTWSYDGSWTLQSLSERFRQRGCRVLLMTEHDRGFSAQRFAEFREACAQVSSDQILVIPGIEYSDAENRVHVLTWGPAPFLGENLPTLEMLNAITAAGGVAVLAHPSRKNAWQAFTPEWEERLLGIEVWNRKYDGWAPSQTAPLLMKSPSLVPFVGLDFHTERQSFPLGMALDMGPAITEDAVLECLRNRRCQARAFGAPLEREPLRKALPALRIAERGRKTAARIARKAGVL